MHFQLFYIFDCDVLVTKIPTIAFLANWLSQVMYFRPFYIFECDVSSHYNPIIAFSNWLSEVIFPGSSLSLHVVEIRSCFMFYDWCFLAPDTLG